MMLSTEDASLSPVGARRVATVITERVEFTHVQVRALRRWYRVTYGITIKDPRQLAREFLSEALKKQWLLVDATDPDHPPPG